MDLCRVWTVFSCGEWGLLSGGSVLASHCSGFPCWDAQALGHSGLSSCGTWAQELQSPGSRAQAQ